MVLSRNNQKVNTDQEVDISVIVAVFNVEKFLPQCLESLKNQTLENAEFLIIDDGSTDSSGSICDQFQQTDKRFKVLHQPNKGSLLARKLGIELARGKWSIFVDGDDYLPSNDVLETELELAEKNNVDILRFDVDVIAESNGKKREFLRWKGDFLGTLSSSREIVAKTFGQVNAISWTLWDKVYRTFVLKQTLPFIQEEKYIPCGTDIFQTFLISFFSSTLCSLKTKPLYTYRYGVGISTGNITISKYEKYAQEVKEADLLSSFLKTQNKSAEYESILETLKRQLIGTATYRFAFLEPRDSVRGFDLLLSNNPIEYVVETLYRIYRNNTSELAARIYGSSRMQSPQRGIKTIAICCYGGNTAEIQGRLLSQLQILSSGYRVVLFTDETFKNCGSIISDAVTSVVLPISYEQGRSFALAEAIRKFNVDLFLGHATSTSSSCLLFDLILVKELGLKTIIFHDELTGQSLITNSNVDVTTSKPYLHRLADVLVVTNAMEFDFYKSCGVSVYYIPKTVILEPERKEKTKPENTKVVLWVGKLNNDQKNYREALEIMASVAKDVANSTCLFVGSGEPGDENFVRNYLEQNQLEDRVKFIRGTIDTGEYYSLADVLLVTSSFETFCEEIAEGKSHGIPLVLYDMPYLDLLKDCKGYISVARHDKAAASAAIMKLLTNDVRRYELGQEAKQSFESFVADQAKQTTSWVTILSELSHRKAEKQKEPQTSEEQVKQNLLFWSTTMSFLEEAQECKNKELQQIRQEREGVIREKEKLEQEKERLRQEKLSASLSCESSLRKSLSFRVGRFITWGPRKLRDGIQKLTR